MASFDGTFKFEIDIKTHLDEANGDLHLMLETGVMGEAKQISEEVVSLKDKAIRESLIKLGWTPPDSESYAVFSNMGNGDYMQVSQWMNKSSTQHFINQWNDPSDLHILCKVG